MPVLVQTGFVEASSTEWVTREEYQKGTLSPLAVYGFPADVVNLPSGLGEDSVKYFDRVIDDVVIPNRRCVFMIRGNGSLLAWLRGRLWSLGYLGKSAGSFGDITVTVFERRP